MTQIDSERRLYENMVRSHASDVYRFAFRLCGKPEMADELVQETFYEAWRSIGSLRDPIRKKAWLLGILRHCYAHTIRDRERRVQLKFDVEFLNQVSDRAGSDVLERLANQELLQRALDYLDDRYKEPFLLVFQEDFTCQEVAEMLDVPLGTVLSRIHRARQSLRRRVRQLDPSNEHLHGLARQNRPPSSIPTEK